jgi:Tol biopolymer transport system component
MNLGPIVNSPYNEDAPSISVDNLTLYFSSDRPGGYGQYDLWVTTRKTTDDPWSEPVNLGPTVNTDASEHAPSISADGLELYFSEHMFERSRPGGLGEADIWVTRRQTKNDPWETPINLGSIINSSGDEGGPCISIDGLALYFFSNRDSTHSDWLGTGDLYVATRKNITDPWNPPMKLGGMVNGPSYDGDPSISADGLMLYFCSHRFGCLGGLGDIDIWQAAVIVPPKEGGDSNKN